VNLKTQYFENLATCIVVSVFRSVCVCVCVCVDVDVDVDVDEPFLFFFTIFKPEFMLYKKYEQFSLRSKC
jgi:hypothetical protein